MSDFTTTTVVDLADIENELKLVQARLLLADSGVDSFSLSPPEVSSLLCKHDMHNEACELLIAFNIELCVLCVLLFSMGVLLSNCLICS